MKGVAALLALVIAAAALPSRAQQSSDLISKAAEARFKDMAQLPPGVMLTLKARLPAEWEGYIADVLAAQSAGEAYLADPELVAGLGFHRFLSARIYQSATAPPASIKRVYRAMRQRSLGQESCDAPSPTTEPWILMIHKTSEELALYTAVQRSLVDAIADARPSPAGAPEMTAETWAGLRSALTAAGGTTEQIDAITKSWTTLPPKKICEASALLFGVLADGPDDTAAAYWASWVKPRPIHTDKTDPDKNIFPLGSWDQAMGKLEDYRPLREGFPAQWAQLRRELADGVARRAPGTDMRRIIAQRRQSAIREAQKTASMAPATDIHGLVGAFAKAIETVNCAAPQAETPQTVAAFAAYESLLYDVARRGGAGPIQHGEATAADRERLQAAFHAKPGFEKRLLSSTATVADQCLAAQLTARASADLPPEVAARLWASQSGPIGGVTPAAAVDWAQALDMPDIQRDFPKEYAAFRQDFQARRRSGADDQTLMAAFTVFSAQADELRTLARARAPISQARAVLQRRLSLLQALSSRNAPLCARWVMGLAWPDGLELNTEVNAAMAALTQAEKAAISAGARSPVSWEALRASDLSTYRDAYEHAGGDLTVLTALERNRVGNIANEALCQAVIEAYKAILSLPDPVVGRFWRQLFSPQSWAAPQPSAAAS